MRSSRKLAVLLVPLFALVLGVDLGASAWASLKEISLDDLEAASDGVIVGTVLINRADFNQARSAIITTSTVAVTQLVVGSVGGASVVRVQAKGGEAGGMQASAKADARLEVGQEVVLFLRAVGSEYEVVSGNGGQFDVVGGIVEKTGQTLAAFVTEIQS